MLGTNREGPHSGPDRNVCAVRLNDLWPPHWKSYFTNYLCLRGLFNRFSSPVLFSSPLGGFDDLSPSAVFYGTTPFVCCDRSKRPKRPGSAQPRKSDKKRDFNFFFSAEERIASRRKNPGFRSRVISPDNR